MINVLFAGCFFLFVRVVVGFASFYYTPGSGCDFCPKSTPDEGFIYFWHIFVEKIIIFQVFLKGCMKRGLINKKQNVTPSTLVFTIPFSVAKDMCSLRPWPCAEVAFRMVPLSLFTANVNGRVKNKTAIWPNVSPRSFRFRCCAERVFRSRG